LGRNPEDLFPPQEKERVEQSRLSWATDPGLAVPVSRQMLHRDGSLRKFDGVIINMLDNPYLKGYVINLTDVTEREQLRSRAQEAKRLEGLGRLAGGVAHDFNNILTVVMGQAELLESRAGGDLRLMRGLSEIRAAADRATGLVSQLLAFARRSVATPRLLHIDQHILSLRGTLVHLLGSKVALTVEPSPGLPAILADPSQVEQVLLNLAANARDAMPQGGSLTINCSAVSLMPGQYRVHPELKAGPYIRMTVADDGVGMDPVTLEHAFEPFFSTKPSGRGTGMGLATCYGIVQQAEGHIDVLSQLNVGTRFDVYWPVAQETQALKASAHLQPGEAVPRGMGELIMVVDDEPQVLTLVTEGLRALGYTIQPFASASAALEWLGGGAKPHLLITDIVMPEIGGEALAGRVQVLVPALPVLYISGYAAGAIARPSWLRVGVNFLPKPFALPDLGLIVRRLLEGEA
jgi:two-component system, cell cycle sensor histidine kinase and response regulator CckA